MSTKDEGRAMLKAVGVLSASEPVKGVIVNPHGVEVPEDVPIFDSHDFARGCLGHLSRAWTENDALWGELIFTGRAGRRAYEMIERGELAGCSCRFETMSFEVYDADGDMIDIEKAVARGADDPDLIVVAQRTILREVSITATPADRNAFVRAIGIDAEAWRMIRQGEATLRRILRPEDDLRVASTVSQILWDDDVDDDGRMMSISEYIEARRNRFHDDGTARSLRIRC
jgi:phage head maturation protease